MKTKENRIYFAGSPFAKGHSVKEFVWSGGIDEDLELWFDLHLETEDYSTDYPELMATDDGGPSASDWQSKMVWGNYHSCTLSSTAWGNEGFKAIDREQVFSFSEISKQAYTVNSLPMPEPWQPDDLAFHIYLLGHDSCAGHHIQFSKNPDNSFNIEWRGKIALSYVGSYDFEYDFFALLNNVFFDGFHYPKEWTREQAQQVFANRLQNIEDYEWVDLNPKSNKREYKLMPKRL